MLSTQGTSQVLLGELFIPSLWLRLSGYTMVLNSRVRNSWGGDLLEGSDGRADILSPSPIQTGNEKGAKRKVEA